MHSIVSKNFFDITNCGISFNSDGSLFATADFGGNLFIFDTNQHSLIPQPVSQVMLGIPVRSLVWCYDTNNIIAGCVGGFLFKWDGSS